MQTVDVGNEFSQRLTNRDESQGDGQNTAVHFRRTYLRGLDNEEVWSGVPVPYITLDFTNVSVMAPSFANEAFAHFAQYAAPKDILKRIQFINITNVKMEIIEIELQSGRER